LFALCNRPDQRLKWQLWGRQLPSRAFDDWSAFTDEQVDWILTQHLIDQGLEWCEHCQALGRHTFCGRCGRRFVGDELIWRTCPNRECTAVVASDWCPLCGTEVANDWLRGYERGEIDLDRENAVAREALAAFNASRPEFAPASREDRELLSLSDAASRFLPHAD
jgi:hypothetical protein